MKKIICVIIVVALIATGVLCSILFIKEDEQDYIIEAPSLDYTAQEDAAHAKEFATFKASDFLTPESIVQAKELFDSGKILVVKNDIEASPSICSALGIPFDVGSLNPYGNANDIATIYYKHNDGKSGLYIVNAADDYSDTEKEYFVVRAINDTPCSPATVLPYSSAESMGTLTVFTASKEKGECKTTYEFFSLQDYNESDYYTVIARAEGYPGAALSVENAAYNSKFKGVGFETSIGSDTSSVTVASHEYNRPVDFGSYLVNNGVYFYKDNDDPNIPENTLVAGVTGNTQSRIFTADIKNDARKEAFSYVCAVTFECPYNKSALEISLQTDYELDSWDTRKETVSIDRTVKITAPNQ